MTNTLTFTCSICGEPSTSICSYCTKDACANHLCDRCGRCSDCCECEVPLEEPVEAAPSGSEIETAVPAAGGGQADDVESSGEHAPEPAAEEAPAPESVTEHAEDAAPPQSSESVSEDTPRAPESGSDEEPPADLPPGHQP